MRHSPPATEPPDSSELEDPVLSVEPLDWLRICISNLRAQPGLVYRPQDIGWGFWIQGSALTFIITDDLRLRLRTLHWVRIASRSIQLQVMIRKRLSKS